MCSQYTIKVSKYDLITQLRLTNDEALELEKSGLPEKILPYNKAPVLHLENKKHHLETMQFSLIPKWSKEPRSKFSTHNARLETIDEKPTFKSAFKSHHAIAPMSGFIEPIYQGKLAGNMVEFVAPSLLYAAAIWDGWVDPKSGEVLRSYSIITHDPVPFVKRTGHDRSPVFLEFKDAEEWMKSEGDDPKALKKFLATKRLEPNLETHIDRPLKPGWEKRK